MSGGRFEYTQYHISNIAESIESEILKQGKEIPKDERWYGDDVTHYHTYSKKTNEEFKKAVKILKEAAVYAQRIDWFLSGDDGEETFHERLADDLENLKKNV